MCDAFGARTVITRISILHLDVDRGQNGKGGPTRTRTDDTALLIHLVTGTPSFTSPYAVASLTRSCDVINGDVWPTCRWRDLFFFVVPFCACAAHHWSIQVMHTTTLTQTGQHQLTICGKKERKRERERDRMRQATGKSITVDQEAYAQKIGLITMSAHRRKHMSGTLSKNAHHINDKTW